MRHAFLVGHCPRSTILGCHKFAGRLINKRIISVLGLKKLDSHGVVFVSAYTCASMFGSTKLCYELP